MYNCLYTTAVLIGKCRWGVAKTQVSPLTIHEGLQQCIVNSSLIIPDRIALPF